MNYTERDAKVIWHPYTQGKIEKPPITIVKGKGCLLYDDTGEAYIDAISSWWVNIHGHAHPYIAKKVAEQLNTLEQVIFAGFTHPNAIELSERLLKHLPDNQSKIFFSDDGSTAVEVAIKMALQYWLNKGKKKTNIIALEHAYHGDTFGTMSLSMRGAFTEPFRSFLFDVERIQVPIKGDEETALNQLKDIVQKGDVAAFIFEPLILGAGGMIMYEPEALEAMINTCKQADVLTIADEVMTGFGRTGKFFATGHVTACPDIFCLSKGLTGGTMAMSITTCTEDIYNAFLSEDRYKTFFHGHSFTANPVVCAAALASLDLLEKKECLDQIKYIEKQHKAFYRLIAKHPMVTTCRMRGTIIALEVKTAQQVSYFNKIRDQLYNRFIEEKVLLRPLGNIVYIMPPYCITKEQLNRVYEVIIKVLDEL